MRLIKAQTTNLRTIYGKGVKYDYDDHVIIDSQRAMLVPKGPNEEQPGYPGDGGANPPILTGATEGQIRYNTTDNQLEAYQNGAWREIRFKEPNQDPGIHLQTFGPGDAIEDTFGLLNSNDPDYPIPATEKNILVFVENVYQIPGTNYELIDNPPGLSPSTGLAYPSGWYIRFADAVPLGKNITVLHNFDK